MVIKDIKQDGKILWLEKFPLIGNVLLMEKSPFHRTHSEWH